jgi:nucleoside-diphosphate-sugar epimerase
MKYLVTGATGFIGANLVKKLLSSHHEIFVITRKTSNDWRLSPLKSNLHICYGDITDRNAIFELMATIRPTIIFHMATYGGFPHELSNSTMVQANLLGTINLLDAAVTYQVPQFINTGSSSEYGLTQHPMKETDRCDPLTFYGLSKLAATKYCSMIGNTLQYPVCTLRLFSVYGELEDPNRLYPTICNALGKGERPRLANPDSVRDFISIEKVCEIYSKIPKANYKAGDIINVGSGKQQTLRQFYTTIAHSLGSPLEPIWGTLPPRSLEPQRWEADISKLQSLIPLTWTDDALCI